jgi:hypothetical protein
VDVPGAVNIRCRDNDSAHGGLPGAVVAPFTTEIGFSAGLPLGTLPSATILVTLISAREEGHAGIFSRASRRRDG